MKWEPKNGSIFILLLIVSGCADGLKGTHDAPAASSHAFADREEPTSAPPPAAEAVTKYVDPLPLAAFDTPIGAPVLPQFETIDQIPDRVSHTDKRLAVFGNLTPPTMDSGLVFAIQHLEFHSVGGQRTLEVLVDDAGNLQKLEFSLPPLSRDQQVTNVPALRAKQNVDYQIKGNLVRGENNEVLGDFQLSHTDSKKPQSPATGTARIFSRGYPATANTDGGTPHPKPSASAAPTKAYVNNFTVVSPPVVQPPEAKAPDNKPATTPGRSYYQIDLENHLRITGEDHKTGLSVPYPATASGSGASKVTSVELIGNSDLVDATTFVVHDDTNKPTVLTVDSHQARQIIEGINAEPPAAELPIPPVPPATPAPAPPAPGKTEAPKEPASPPLPPPPPPPAAPPAPPPAPKQAAPPVARRKVVSGLPTADGIFAIDMNNPPSRANQIMEQLDKNSGLPEVQTIVARIQTQPTSDEFRKFEFFLQAVADYIPLISKIYGSRELPGGLVTTTLAESNFFSPRKPFVADVAPNSSATGPFAFLGGSNNAIHLHMTVNKPGVLPPETDERLYFVPSACAHADYFDSMVKNMVGYDATLTLLSFMTGEQGFYNVVAKSYSYDKGVARSVADLISRTSYKGTYRELAVRGALTEDQRIYVARILAYYLVTGDVVSNGHDLPRVSRIKIPLNRMEPPHPIQDPRCRALWQEFQSKPSDTSGLTS